MITNRGERICQVPDIAMACCEFSVNWLTQGKKENRGRWAPATLESSGLQLDQLPLVDYFLQCFTIAHDNPASGEVDPVVFFPILKMLVDNLSGYAQKMGKLGLRNIFP